MSKHDKYSIDNTDYTIGQDNVQKWGFDVHNAVFGVSAGLIIIFFSCDSSFRSSNSESSIRQRKRSDC